MDKFVWIVAPETYKRMKRAYGIENPFEEANYYGVKFRTAKPTKKKLIEEIMENEKKGGV